MAIDRDLAAFRAEDSLAGVGLAYNHRQFDVDWLRSTNAAFRLVAVARLALRVRAAAVAVSS